MTLDDVFDQIGKPSRGSFEVLGKKILGTYEYDHPSVDLIVSFDSSTLEVLYVKNVRKNFLLNSDGINFLNLCCWPTSG